MHVKLHRSLECRMHMAEEEADLLGNTSEKRGIVENQAEWIDGDGEL